jgi:PDZ domain-containing secreted protein
MNSAGFRIGDEIQAVDWKPVRSPAELSSRLETAARTTGLAFVYVRRNERSGWLYVDFTAAVRPLLGMQLKDSNHKVLVSAVSVGSPAAQAGFQVGDQITAIDGNPVALSADVGPKVTAAAELDRTVTVDVIRNGAPRQINLTLAANRDADDVEQTTVGDVRQAASQIRATLIGLEQSVHGKARYEILRVRATADQFELRIGRTEQDAVPLAPDRRQAIRNDLQVLRNALADLVNRTPETARQRVQQALDETNAIDGRLVSPVQKTVVR